jgi:sec-independent protein translocase protein TatA
MGNIGALEITLIILVLVLLFGAKKLPELARGSGRALRIFKAETKGLMDDDDDDEKKQDKEPDARSEADRTRELEGPREPLHTDSVRTDLSYDERHGDQR